MYVEEIICKRNGKEYRSSLVRESFRLGSTVKHRTIANISNLPQGCIQEIKRYLKGESSNLDFSQVQVIDSKEYGACQSVLCFAKKLELDNIIFPRKVQWREDVLAMLVGRLLYPGNELSLTKKFIDTVLWEACGHLPNFQPDISKHCYDSLNQLLSRQKFIQKKLKKKHLDKKSIALFFLTSTLVEEEWENRKSFNGDNDHKKQYKELNTALLTDADGRPLSIRTISTANEGQKKFQDQAAKIKENFKLQSLILIADQATLETFASTECKTITALSSIETKTFLEKNTISPHLFLSNQYHEIYDSITPIRYIVYLNLEKKKEQSTVRNELIKKTEEFLRKIQNKSQPTTILEVEKIWTIFRTETFFNWHIEEGVLSFSINKSQVIKEEQLNGCCVICTNVEKELLSALDTVNAYQKLNQIQQSFKIIKIISTDLCHVFLEDRIHAHMLLSMLSYYLQWHIDKKLKDSFNLNDSIKVKNWTFTEVIEKLKSIRSQTIQIGNITLNNVKTTLNIEQREIVSALGITLTAKF